MMNKANTSAFIVHTSSFLTVSLSHTSSTPATIAYMEFALCKNDGVDNERSRRGRGDYQLPILRFVPPATLCRECGRAILPTSQLQKLWSARPRGKADRENTLASHPREKIARARTHSHGAASHPLHRVTRSLTRAVLSRRHQ